MPTSFLPQSCVSRLWSPARSLRNRHLAERVFNGTGGAQFRPVAIGYSLLFAKRYADAVPIWKQFYEKANPNDPAPRGLYAVALEQSGHAAEAAPL